MIGSERISMRAIQYLLLSALAAPGVSLAMDCSAPAATQPLRPTVLVPVASELAVVANLPGMPQGVLADSVDATQSVDQVLLRIRIESCQNVATIMPSPGVVGPDNPAAYKPKTEFDNTPWRFNMSQNGKKMTADEFSAWMKARGVRVARGAGAAMPAQDAAVPPADTAAPVDTQPAQPQPVTPPKP
jgi:hypothetical protein